MSRFLVYQALITMRAIHQARLQARIQLLRSLRYSHSDPATRADILNSACTLRAYAAIHYVAANTQRHYFADAGRAEWAVITTIFGAYD